MRPVSSVWMTVRSSASSCSKFHKATRDPVPPRQKKKKKKKTSDVLSLKMDDILIPR